MAAAAANGATCDLLAPVARDVVRAERCAAVLHVDRQALAVHGDDAREVPVQPAG